MGGQQSTRRVSFQNDVPDNVVKVSEKVVVELLKKASEDGTVGHTAENIPNSITSKQDPNITYVNAIPIAAKGDDDDFDTDMKSKYEDEIRRTNEEWERKIKELQACHEKMNSLYKEEYQKGIEHIEQLFGKPPNKDKKPPCQDKKSSILSCYKKNAGQTLLCANEVKEFEDCFNSARAQSQA